MNFDLEIERYLLDQEELSGCSVLNFCDPLVLTRYQPVEMRLDCRKLRYSLVQGLARVQSHTPLQPPKLLNRRIHRLELLNRGGHEIILVTYKRAYAQSSLQLRLEPLELDTDVLNSTVVCTWIGRKCTFVIQHVVFPADVQG